MNATELARTRPGHVRVVIEGADEATVYAMAGQVAAYCNVTGPSQPWRVPGVDGVRVALYGHVEAAAPDA